MLPRSLKWIALCLFSKWGLFLVKKRTGKKKTNNKNVRTEVPTYVCWLPSGMIDLAMADHKNWPWIHCLVSCPAPCTTTVVMPAGLPLCLAGQLPAPSKAEDKLPCSLWGASHILVTDGRIGAALCWASSSCSARLWTSLGSQGESIYVDTGFLLNPKGQAWAA